MIEVMLFVLFGAGALLFLTGWAIGLYVANRTKMAQIEKMSYEYRKEIEELTEAVITQKVARQEALKRWMDKRIELQAELKMTDDRLKQLDDAWAERTGKLFKYQPEGAADIRKEQAGKLVDTKVATGDIDQVIIEAPEGSSVKLKKDK